MVSPITDQQPQREHHTLRAKARNQAYRIETPPSDIDSCIQFSWFRCICSVMSFLLVISDIPRSGFGVNDLGSDVKPVATDAAMYFGPYAYGVTQIQKNDSRSSNDTASSSAVVYHGTQGGVAITEADVWFYKYDSLSVVLRGVVEILGIREYPRCLLYLDACPSTTLTLETTFTMLDGLVNGLRTTHFQQHDDEQQHRGYPPFVFRTKSYWIDRLHHYILSKFLWHRVDTRLHAAHYYRGIGSQAEKVEVCSPMLPRARRPFFCTQVIGWEVDISATTVDGVTSTVKMKAADHISQRLASLERQYPHLQFDLTVLTTRLATTNLRQYPQLTAVFFRSESTEISTLIRGRMCDAQNGLSRTDNCTTFLVDDYRYERAMLYTNAEDWHNVTRFLRAASQFYVWLRIVLLWVGCYCARRHEARFASAALHKRLYLTWKTVLKVPSHVIVYGSWVPILLYVAAYLLDCGIVHLLCERVWTTLYGAVQFDLLTYVNVASIQMRNTWLIALVVRSLAALQVHSVSHRLAPWILRQGFVGIRSGLIGFLSSLTIFSYVRFSAFRNTKIIAVEQLPSESFRAQRLFSSSFESPSEFGFYFDLRTIFAGLLATSCAIVVVKLYLVWWSRRRTRRSYEPELATQVIFSRSYYLPYSVGTLAPLAALSLFWRITVLHPASFQQQSSRKQPSALRSSRKVAAEELTLSGAQERRNTGRLPVLPEHSQYIVPGHRVSTNLQRANSRSPDSKNNIFQVKKRPIEMWSVVQLINIALLTEPLALLSVYVAGQDLYLYRVNDRSPANRTGGEDSPPTLFLLPCDPTTLAQNTRNSGRSDITHRIFYEFVAIVDSKTVPWRLLTQLRLLIDVRGIPTSMRVQHASDPSVQLQNSIEIAAKHRARTYRVQSPRSDIDACIKFSWIRFAYSIVGLLLVASDIPRTGYGIRSLTSDFEQVAPDTVMYFGPYAYPVAEIRKNDLWQRTDAANGSPLYGGMCEGSELAGMEVWSYKYDSLSIVLRGAVTLLGVSEYPRCLLYVEECPSKILSLETTFKMLDALVAALYRGYFQQQHVQERFAAHYAPYVLQTKSYWIDRFFHFTLDKLSWRRVDTRFHAVHYYRGEGANGTLNVCSPKLPRTRQPFFCDLPVAWEFDASSLTVEEGVSSRTTVPAHISQRMSSLEHQHPHLQFDLTVFTTMFPTSNLNQFPKIPSVYYRSDSSEITTIIRGRICPDRSRGAHAAQGDDCETVIVNDYRYEAATLETNSQDWYRITGFMRGLAQLYVWLRLLFLWLGCYFACCREPTWTTLPQQIFLTSRTVFKIPSHTIIYGSWIPIVLYSVAHFIDCGLVHTISENVWSSLNGAVQLDVWVYVSVASVQMRNIWFIALAVKLVVLIQIYCVPQRLSPWLLRDGLVGFRGALTGLLSSLTIFAYLRFPEFRNTKILAVRALPAHSFRRQRQFSSSFEGVSEFGFHFDLRMMSAVLLAILCIVASIKVFLAGVKSHMRHHLPRRCSLDLESMTGVTYSRSHYIPYSVGTLVSVTALSTFWKISLRKSSPEHLQHETVRLHRRCPPVLLRSRKVSASELRNLAAKITGRLLPQTERFQEQETISKRGADRASIAHVEKRSKAMWSVVQLVNIALLTEPLALLNLYVFGQDLYLYRVKTQTMSSPNDIRASSRSLFLLPCDPASLAQNASDDDIGTGVYDLVDVVGSKTVPWRLLIYCG